VHVLGNHIDMEGDEGGEAEARAIELASN